MNNFIPVVLIIIMFTSMPYLAPRATNGFINLVSNSKDYRGGEGDMNTPSRKVVRHKNGKCSAGWGTSSDTSNDDDERCISKKHKIKGGEGLGGKFK